MPEPTSPADLVTGFLAGHPAKPLIVVLGPTASGKTGFSIRLATQLLSLGIRTEVVNADSRQFYRQFDIGTAKITAEEMQRVPHHLLSVLDPKQDCSIAWFQEAASAVIADIHARGAVPMLVGGSMLYISSIIDGFEPVAADPDVRRRLTEDYDSDGGVSLMRKLQEVDPESARSIPVQNKVYVIRALEIYEVTGKPKSRVLGKKGSPYDLLMFGMQTDADELKNRINTRTLQMIDGGWVEEVKLLLEQGYTENDPAMESHGYREITAALRRGDVDRAKLVADISAKVRQYAKRSVTWWKRDPRIVWIKP